MEKLFGKSPNMNTENIVDLVSQQNTPEVSTSILIEEMDPILEWRIKTIVAHIWTSMKPGSGIGKIIEQTHNTVINTIVSKIEFKWTNQDSCLITFNDRIDDDDFEVEWDMDHNPDSVNDVYAVRVHESWSFRVERWHPDENNILHFRPVAHDHTEQMVLFVEWCMDLGSGLS